MATKKNKIKEVIKEQEIVSNISNIEETIEIIKEIKEEKKYKVDFKVKTTFWDISYIWVSEVTKEIYNSLKNTYFVEKWDIILL